MDRADAIKLLAAECPVWAMSPAHIEATATALVADARMAARSTRTTPAPRATAIIPIMGPLTRRASFLSDFFGSSTYSGIRSQIRDALAMRDVQRIVLWIDSPGGVALGVEELAADIRQANKVKPVIAVADVLMASAALWLASQAGQVIATPSAEIGSVGAVQLHIDTSRALDKAGIEPTFIQSTVSPFKTEGNAFEPLGNDAKAHFQEQIDELAGRFVRDLARGRRVSEATAVNRFGQGRLMFANQAERVGLVDAIQTFEQVLAGQTNFGKPAGRGAALTHPQPSRASLSSRRRRLALLKAG